MAIQNTTNLSDSIRTLYIAKYIEAAKLQRVYDQLAAPVSQFGVEQAARLGATIQVPFLMDMTPGTTAISQTSDITPQTLVDTTASVTTTSRGEALQWAEVVDIQVYTNYGESRFAALGKNQMESIDLLAQAAALQGSLVKRGAARASLDAGTSGHRMTDARLAEVEVMLQTLKCPYFVNSNGRQQWFAIGHPAAFYDLRAGGNVVSIAQYQDKEIILNQELGQFGPFKIMTPAWAKVFGAAGADNASNAATTLASAAAAGDKTIEVAAADNLSAGDWLTIGTEETANTFYPTNERVQYVSESGTTITIIGEGANGGLRFAHASGVAVRNADDVFPVAFGGPMSLVKAFDAQTGEFGEVVGPKKQGVADQFATLAWKYYGGYGRWVESWIVRGEYATSLEA